MAFSDLDLIKAVLLIIAVSADGFCFSFGLGASGIEIPARSAAVISSVGTAFLVLSALLGNAAVWIVPPDICRVISCVILVFLGLCNLFHKLLGRIADKLPRRLRAFFCDESEADCDRSKDISCGEAFALSAALSADSLAAGLGAGLGEIPLLLTGILSFLIGFFFVIAANFLGRKASCGEKIDLRAFGGLILIVVGIIK